MIRRIAPVLLVLAALGFSAQYADYVKDDTYISLRYAYNLANGNGLVFNPGSETFTSDPVEGYTNFLWVLTGAVIHVLGLGDYALWILRIIGLSAAVLLALGTWALARRLLKQHEAGALFAGLLVASLPTVGIYSMSGMETVPFAALVVWSFERAIAHHPNTSILLGVFACLMRPEGHLLGALGGLWILGSSLQKRPGAPSVRKVLTPAAIALLALAAYHSWRYHRFGSLIPNTALVKNGHGYFSYEGMNDLIDIYQLYAVPLMVLAGAFAALLLRSATLLAFMALAAFFHGYLLWVGGDEMDYGRLLLPALPFVAIAAGAALGMVTSNGTSVTVGIVGAILAIGISIPNHLALSEELRGWHQGMLDSQQRLGADLEAELGPGAVVAYQDMGLCPYSSPTLNFIDVIGLVSRDVSQLRVEEEVVMQGGMASTDAEANDKARRFASRLRDYVFAKKPDAIAFVLVLKHQPMSASGDARWREIDAATRGFGYSYGLTRDPRLAEQYTWFADYARNETTRIVALVRRDRSE